MCLLLFSYLQFLVLPWQCERVRTDRKSDVIVRVQIILFPLTVADPTRDNALFMPPKTTEMNANADEK